jgi:hypothetical protein
MSSPVWSQRLPYISSRGRTGQNWLSSQTNYWTGARNTGYLIAAYSEWILFDVGILWILTLIFIDHDVQQAWRRTRVGKLLSQKKPRSNIGLAFVFLIAVGLWLMFFRGEFLQYINWVQDA